MIRLTFDPGQTTGVAWRDPASDDVRSLEVHGDDVTIMLDGFRTGPGVDEVVYEIFRSRPGPAVNLSAPHCIGRLFAWAEAHGVPIIGQEVAAAKRRVNDDRLRESGNWVRGSTHERDARRHLLYREEKATGVKYW